MSNTQFYLTLGIPFITLLLVYITSTISNRGASNDLRSEMRAGFDGLRSEMHGSTDALRSEMHGGFASMHERLGRIEQRQDLLDRDIRISHEHRLSVLETRVLGSPR